MTEHPATLTRRYDGLFIATFPEVPDVAGYGRDPEEALEEASKTLQSRLGRRTGSARTAAPSPARPLMFPED